MSAGQFITTKYESDSGNIYPIRVQPETTALVLNGQVNNPPSGAQTEGVLARVSGGRRRIGLKARNVRIQFAGAAPDGYKDGSTITLPILTPAVFNALPTTGGTGTYLGVAVNLIGKSSQAGR